VRLDDALERLFLALVSALMAEFNSELATVRALVAVFFVALAEDNSLSTFLRLSFAAPDQYIFCFFLLLIFLLTCLYY